ncbi:MAG TPA: zinc metalloprotease HtpX [Candidatus Polarisedimenticolia bacterium]|jgi:heat shock protein HtpX|nr:zinc metalloprotease HtpX [Candidatus Polarisedimenticolia bacterium]
MNAVKTAFLLGLLSALIVALGSVFGGPRGMILALGLAAVMNFFSYWFSDRMVLAWHRAQPVSREQAPQLYEILERLTARAGIPMPRVYVLPEEAPNAFATGRNPQHAAVAVTHGILRLLNAEELEGVLAHELSHVKNRDILIGSIAATLAAAVMVIANMARWAAFFGGGQRDDRGGTNPIAFLATVILAPIAATLIQLAVSRSREFQADATGAEMTHNPYGLANALQKLEDSSRRIPMQTAGPASSHLFIVKPFTGGALTNLFSTHPPIRERIRRLTGR